MKKLSILFFSIIISLFFILSAEAAQNEDVIKKENIQEANQIQNREQTNILDAEKINEEDSVDFERNLEQERTREQVLIQEQNNSQVKKDEINLEEHRSVVANSVQSILQIADQEEIIGQQIRVIAQQQNESIDATVQAMEKVQARNKFQIFLFGSDYKNLGSLRSEMVQTQNRIEQLNRLTDDIQDENDKIEIQNQIQILEQEKNKIENFVQSQENTFSLFGWLAKLFNK